MEKVIKELEKAIAKNYGKRCPDYEPDCVVCKMWKAFETIKEGFENIEK